MKVVVIDDEKNSRELLDTLLRNYCDINDIRTASNLEEAEEIINIHNPDLIFLDIQLNDENGFDLLKKFQNASFHTCFATGYSEFGIQAANNHAIGYLVKPIDLDELKAVVKRARVKLKERESNLATKTIIISENGETWILNVGEILYVTSESSYTFVQQRSNQKLISSKSLNYFEQILPEDSFVRSHRSHILNLSEIGSIKDGRTAVATMSDGYTVPIANRRKKDFYQKFDLFNT